MKKQSNNFFLRLWRHPKGRTGIIIAMLLIFCAVFAPYVAPYAPYNVTQRAAKGLAPSLSHPLGTTITTGQDIFSMLIYGTRVSLIVGVVTGICTAFLGALMGLLAGYVGGVVGDGHRAAAEPDDAFALEVAQHPGDYLPGSTQVVGDGLVGGF